MPDDLAIVTGAGGALGRAVAQALAADGMRVVGVDRSAEALAFLPPGIAGEAGSITDQEEALELFDRIGPPRVVVNTVGGYHGDPAADTTPDTLHQMLTVNLESAWWVSQAAARHMRGNGGGAIVLVAAKQGLDAVAGSAAYSVSKAAVVQLVRVLDAELHDDGIRVNAVVPRLIDTPANRAAFPASAMARAVAPEAIARVIAFLASDAAAPVSGAIVPVYG